MRQWGRSGLLGRVTGPRVHRALGVEREQREAAGKEWREEEEGGRATGYRFEVRRRVGQRRSVRLGVKGLNAELLGHPPTWAVSGCWTKPRRQWIKRRTFKQGVSSLSADICGPCCMANRVVADVAQVRRQLTGRLSAQVRRHVLTRRKMVYS